MIGWLALLLAGCGRAAPSAAPDTTPDKTIVIKHPDGSIEVRDGVQGK
jgi:hypothetical protein